MKKSFLCLSVAVIFAAVFFLDQTPSAVAGDRVAVSPNLVISQFQAGGTTNANDEFIEIHNNGPLAVDLNGHRLVYRSQNGTNDTNFVAWTTSTLIQPGQYYLIASTAYTGSITPNLIYNNTSCSCAMAAGNGGLAIRLGAPNEGTIIDAVGWGTGSNIFFEGERTTAPPNSSSKVRLDGGCRDTDNNLNDFATLTPSAPRNSSAPVNICNGGGTTLFAAMTANPSTVTVPGNTLLSVVVVPATVPPSTNITVTGDLSDIGGAVVQPFFDDGTNGDVTPGDNTFSYLASIAGTVSTGTHVVSATAHDAQGRTAPVSLNLAINGVPGVDDPLLFGNPSNATANTANENNYLMTKPQYSLSYSRGLATANWVAWRLDSSWIGTAPRQDDFRPDPALPAGWYRVTDGDYSGSGYDRGHMCPSGDRTRTIPDNSATFLMTNIIPQLGANNQGPWADLENYCRTLAASGNELYIISGGHGSAGTIGSASNPINVPAVTWKVVLVLPNGDDDLARVSRSTRTFGVIMSNQSITQGSAWRNYRTTVDAVEYLTGYNFFSAIPKNTQEIIERRRDRQ